MPSEPKESDEWRRVYADPENIKRRQNALPAKLAKLGLRPGAPGTAILDTCCGHGECLEALYAMGFRNLTGVDVRLDASLRADTRFATREGDVRQLELASGSFDWILNIHAMHHLGGAPEIERFRDECHRLLRPGGRIGIIDFDDRLAIRTAFWVLRHLPRGGPAYLDYLSRLVRSEWSFLKDYLPAWGQIEPLWLKCGKFKPVQIKTGLFYFYWVLEKT